MIVLKLGKNIYFYNSLSNFVDRNNVLIFYPVLEGISPKSWLFSLKEYLKNNI